MAKRKPKKLPTFLQADEPELLIRATTHERDRLICMCMLYLGLRVSEVCKLQVDHLDFNAARPLVMVREGKGARDRCRAVPTRLVGPLRDWIAVRRDGPVFPSPRGGHIKRRTVQMLVKRLAAKAGLRQAGQPRAVCPHKFRHAFASRMLERGATLQPDRPGSRRVNHAAAGFPCTSQGMLCR